MSINLAKRKKLEQKVTAFLVQYGKDAYAKEQMAPHVAKISLMMNHLYQDLGFDNRFQMGIFMKKYFPKLSKEKPKNVLWKKYIYDSIGEVAPACATCETKVNCFACKVI
jgi:nitrogen fixation protein NifQ